MLGAFSAFIESLLAVPQAIKNCKRKSTSGLSLVLVFCWFGGDAFKTYYYFFRDAPLQLSVCAVFQLSVDILILMQILYFGKIKKILEKKRSINKEEPASAKKAKYKRAEEEISTDDDETPASKVQPPNPSQKLSGKKKPKAFRTLVNEE